MTAKTRTCKLRPCPLCHEGDVMRLTFWQRRLLILRLTFRGYIFMPCGKGDGLAHRACFDPWAERVRKEVLG